MAHESFWSKDLSHFKDFHFGVAEDFFKVKSWTYRQRTRGYQFYTEGYIHDVFTCPMEYTIRANCYRSQKKNERPHSLHLKFHPSKDGNFDMLEAHCTCLAGNSESCNHVVGLAYYLQHLILNGYTEIPETASCTSIPMQWNKPRGKKILPEPIRGSVFYDPTNTERTKAPVICRIKNPISNTELHEITQSSVDSLKRSLQDLDPSIPFATTLSTTTMNSGKQILLENGTNYFHKITCWILFVFQIVGCYVPASSMLGHMARVHRSTAPVMEQEEVPCLPIVLPLVEKDMVDILISMPPVQHVSLEDVSMERAAEIESNTRNQSQSNIWHNLRRFRFTASKFGYVCKRRMFNAEFLKQFVDPPDISKIKAVAYGLKNETVAIGKFLELHSNFTYYKCGLVIHPYAIHLGASPDGILYDSLSSTYGVLEVKCPCSTKATTVKEYSQLKTFCMKLDENKILKLKRDHDYYFQVQGQMLILGLKWAKFVIYIGKGQEIISETIHFDPIFCQEMYNKLTERYEKYIKESVLIIST